jgi:hypothetical protein
MAAKISIEARHFRPRHGSIMRDHRFSFLHRNILASSSADPIRRASNTFAFKTWRDRVTQVPF